MSRMSGMTMSITTMQPRSASTAVSIVLSALKREGLHFLQASEMRTMLESTGALDRDP